MMQQGAGGGGNYLAYQQQQQQSYHHQQQQQQSPQQLISMQQQQQHHQMNNNNKNQGASSSSSSVGGGGGGENGGFFNKRITTAGGGGGVPPANSDMKSLARPTDSVPEAKKARYDMSQQNPSTKVVSLRNIPNEITDLQIVLMGLQFGDVVNILYIRGKGQALIDFGTLNEAIAMVQYFHHMAASPIPVLSSLSDQKTSLNKSIEAAHSSYQQLTIDNNRAAATLNTIALGKQLKEASLLGGDNCVVKVIFSNVVYPIQIDALNQVFSKYGNVLKIVLTQKNDLGALIQMKDELQVQQALNNLNNRNMYNTYAGGCNILNLQVSHHKSLDVKSNNNKSWDYTNPLLPMGVGVGVNAGIDSLAQQQQQQQQQHQQQQRLDMNYSNSNMNMNMNMNNPNEINLMSGNNGNKNLSNININSMTGGGGGVGIGPLGGGVDHPLLPMPMNQTMSGGGGGGGFNNFNNPNQPPFLQQQQQQQQQMQPLAPHHHHHQHHHHNPHHQQQQQFNNMGGGMQGMHLHQHHGPPMPHHHGGGGSFSHPQQQQQQQHPYAQAAAAAAAVQSMSGGYPMQQQQQQSMDTRSAVVQVSNFPDQIANPDALFTLFGVYGDILKVKIMYNRRDNALMQFKSCDQAMNAVSKMDKVKLFDHIVSVGLSKFPEIQIPIKNDGGLAKDYLTSPLHRFKKPGSKNFFNIYAPNQTLHLSNISQTTSQDKVQELFAKYGTIVNFKWISKEGNKMALIEMSTLEEAVLSLIALHNFQLNGSYLRVNFANKSGKQ